MITLNDIKNAKNRLQGIINQTSLTYAPILSKELNSDIFLKKRKFAVNR